MASNLSLKGILIGIVFATAGCVSREPATISLPGKFVVNSGGFLGDSFSVELDGKQLIYRRLSSQPFRSRTVRLSPTADQWQTFWAQADAIDFWNWEPSYRPTGLINDGTRWSVNIEYRGRKVTSTGDNAYPASSDPAATASPTPSQRFRRFITAIRALVGGRDFY